MADLADRIASLDISLFAEVPIQIEPAGRRTLLALHAACRSAFGEFTYLEIGSHLGGSLQTFIRDPSCRAIISIDPRPSRQPDERGLRYAYPENSTKRMLENLARLPGADLSKLATIERSTEDIQPDTLSERPQLAFVDGEHTDQAALRDARFCAAAMQGAGCIAFHDAQIVYRAIGSFLEECEKRGQPFRAIPLPNAMFVVELGPSRLLATEPLRSLTDETYRAYLHALEATTPYLADYRRLSRRILRRLERATRHR